MGESARTERLHAAEAVWDQRHPGTARGVASRDRGGKCDRNAVVGQKRNPGSVSAERLMVFLPGELVRPEGNHVAGAQEKQSYEHHEYC